MLTYNVTAISNVITVNHIVANFKIYEMTTVNSKASNMQLLYFVYNLEFR